MTIFCTAADVKMIFGDKNVTAWADLDNDRASKTISDRVTWACELSSEYLTSRIINRGYSLPFANVPIRIKHLAAMGAGILLYDGRMIKENAGAVIDEVSRARKEYHKGIFEIISGRVRLVDPLSGEELASQSSRAPEIAEPSTTQDLALVIDGFIVGRRSLEYCHTCCCSSCVCRSLVPNHC